MRSFQIALQPPLRLGRVGKRAPRPSAATVAVTVAGVLASTGTVYVGARNLLTVQADRARSAIPKSWGVPPRADGIYTAGGGKPQRWQRGMDFDLHLMIFGDSTATGYGCRTADEPVDRPAGA